MRLLAAVAALLGLSAVVAPAAAVAADVDAQDPSRWVRVRAADGELNRVTVSHAERVVTVHDAGAELLAGAGCEQVDPHEARCVIAEGEPRVDVSLGGGDDEATALGALPVKLAGEGGNDVLTGGEAGDRLDGGDGDDRLAGGAGVDSYDGGEGNDSIAARDNARETILCGGGQDVGDADVADDLALDCEGVVKPLTPTGTGSAQPAPGRSVAVAVKSGTVLARTPGAAGFTALDPALPVPVGTVLDTTSGTLALTAAADRSGATQTADFTGGRFAVGQTGAVTLTTELRMAGGDFASCPAPARVATARAAAGRRRVVRKLWGSGRGRFRTRGRTSAATVRGTIWQVEDRCDGTLTRVVKGVVVVQNLRTKRTRVVRAGETYLVRRRTRR